VILRTIINCLLQASTAAAKSATRRSLKSVMLDSMTGFGGSGQDCRSHSLMEPDIEQREIKIRCFCNTTIPLTVS
jgi:hypothetical protein